MAATAQGILELTAATAKRISEQSGVDAGLSVAELLVYNPVGGSDVYVAPRSNVATSGANIGHPIVAGGVPFTCKPEDLAELYFICASTQTIHWFLDTRR